MKTRTNKIKKKETTPQTNANITNLGTTTNYKRLRTLFEIVYLIFSLEYSCSQEQVSFVCIVFGYDRILVVVVIDVVVVVVVALLSSTNHFVLFFLVQKKRNKNI